MTKKLLLLLIPFLALINEPIFSQDRIFKPFKVDVAALLDLSLDNSSGGGAGIAIEPRYGVNDNFVVGLRLEGAFLNNSNIDISFTGVNVDQSYVYSILFTGDYYLGYEVIRPFIGTGIGLSTMKTEGVSTGWTGVNVGSASFNRFCFSPRVGVNIKHFKLAGIFNLSGKDIPNYFGIQLGCEFGGGYN